MLTMGSGPCLRRACCSHVSVVGCFPYVQPWPSFPTRVTGIGVSGRYQLCWTLVNSTLSSFLLKATGMGQDSLGGSNSPKEASSSGSPPQQGIEVIGTGHLLSW